MAGSATSRNARDNNHFAIGFLTALVADELSPAHGVLEKKGWKKAPTPPDLKRAGISAWSKEIDGEDVIAYTMAIDGMGQTKSAIETTAFLSLTNVQISFLVGIAGSLKEGEVHRKDVVVGTSFDCRALNKISDGEHCPVYRERPVELPLYPAGLAKRITMFIDDKYSNLDRQDQECSIQHIHAGKIFTWDYVVNSASVVKDLNDSFGAFCVEMEAGGFLRSIAKYVEISKKSGIGFVVRGISDYAAKKVDNHVVRKDASRSASEVAIDLAEWMLTADQRGLLKSDFWQPPRKFD